MKEKNGTKKGFVPRSLDIKEITNLDYLVSKDTQLYIATKNSSFYPLS